MGTSTTAGLIFPPKHFRRLHRILIVPAPKIRPYPTEIRVLFPSRKPRVSFTLSPIFFFFFPPFIYFAYTRFNDPPRCSGRGKSNIVIESFHYAEIFFSIEGNVRTSFSFFPSIVIYYVKSIIKTRFFFSGNLELCEVNTPEKSSSFIFVNTRVDCQLNWNFYPLLFWQTYDGTM